MSNKNRPRLSLRGDQNVPTTEPTQQAQVEISAPTQEKPMEAVQEKTPEVPPEVSGPTAKELAAAEEANAARVILLAKQASQEEPPAPTPIADVAARGYDALHEAFRKHNEKQALVKAYVPPPRTERQMSALKEELEAGARSVARAKAQQEASRPVPTDGHKEGFTTPVYRPGDVVPDPVTKGVMKGFSPDV